MQTPRVPALPKRTSFRSGWFGAVVLLGLLLAFPDTGTAQITLLQRDAWSLDLGGYVRTLSGLSDLGYEIDGVDRTSGFNAEVLRLKWALHVGERAVFEIQERAQLQVSSQAAGYGSSVAGFGVSVVPGRSLDLSTHFVDKDRLQAWHDVDRLAVTVYTGLGDVTAGRQAITWGLSGLFPVADLWAQFSPFELDTEEKPGTDAVRVLSYPIPGLEVDAVVADKGSSEDLSAGIRASLSLPWGDVYAAGGKFWNEALAMGGASVPVGSWILRGEGVVPYDLDADRAKSPRLTLGVDWLGGETMISGEYHFNGIGAPDPEEYGRVLQDPRFARGESYFLGRHYVGALANWTPGNNRLSMAVSAMTNLQDPSLALTPVVTYDFGQHTRASMGGLLSFGDSPSLTPTPVFRSEYGSYGDLLFTRVSIYF